MVPQTALMGHEGIRMTVEEALVIFDLEPPVTPERVEERHQTLRLTWHPHRYANMTNNPKQYTKMYRKAEEMMKDIEQAYATLLDWLQSHSTDARR